MNSTSSFSLVEARNLDLAFEADVFRPWTWKEAATRVLKEKSASSPHRFEILKRLSFKIHRGERVGIMGVNGVGKTSLCRCIAGLYKPTKGDIIVRGQVRAVFDTAIGVQPELTGRENAELLSHFIYPELEDPVEVVQEALQFSELGRAADMPFRLYSNGMQARLCLSLISCRPADLLILDEVFDGADAFFRQKISVRVLKLIEQSGAVLFVSHSAEQIERVCHRVIILRHGEIAYDGPVEAGLRLYEASGAGPGAAMMTV